MVDCARLLSITKFKDERGFFTELCPGFIEDTLGVKFFQDNLSFSKRGVVRGLHYQWSAPMGKLVSVISGSIVDHVVDIRVGSVNFGRCYSYNLSEESNSMLWVPPGFAHGFEALEDSYVHYKCSSVYNSESEGSINIFDKSLKIPLQTVINDVIISERDRAAISFDEYCADPKFIKEIK